MKSKTIYTIIGAIIFVAAVVLWKLNSYYKQEKSVTLKNQIHQQTLSLTTALSGQLVQLKNIISSYQGAIDESKMNWIQINPFFALAQVEISDQGVYQVKKIIVKSDSLADNWSPDFLQKAFSYSRYSNKEIHAQLFQNRAGDKFISLIFADQKIKNSRSAVALIGEATYFQKYFDAQRSAKVINLVMTSDSVVAGHSQSDYLATKTQEGKLSEENYSIEKDEIRSTNLTVMSYASNTAISSAVAIPLFVLVFIFGFIFILIGLILYNIKPIENEQRKAEIFKKVFEEVQSKPTVKAEPVVAKKAILPEPVAESIPLAPVVIPPPPPVVEMPNPEIIISGVKNVELSEVIGAALTAQADVIARSQVKVETVFDSNKKYEVDTERFRRALENIILNSIEAQAKKITIKVYDKSGTTLLDVIDDGQGIDDSLLDKVWQPYFGTKEKLKHRGLGLPEALSVVRRYGADIRIISHTGSSATGVTLRIDMKPDLNMIAGADQVTSDLPVDDIDIDALLSLDDQDDVATEKPEIQKKIEQEFTTTQFKLDHKINISESPQIQHTKTTRAVDSLTVKVRKPGRS